MHDHLFSFTGKLKLSRRFSNAYVRTLNISQTSILDNPSVFIFQVAYLVPMIMQIFLPCIFGQLLSNAYEELNSSIYRANWVPREKRFRSSLTIMMENFKETVKISAYGLFNVDLETFTKVGNSAFSLYAVLKSF